MFALLQVHRIIFIIPLSFNGGHDQSFRNDDVLGAHDINNNSTIYSNVGGRARESTRNCAHVERGGTLGSAMTCDTFKTVEGEVRTREIRSSGNGEPLT